MIKFLQAVRSWFKDPPDENYAPGEISVRMLMALEGYTDLEIASYMRAYREAHRQEREAT